MIQNKQLKNLTKGDLLKIENEVKAEIAIQREMYFKKVAPIQAAIDQRKAKKVRDSIKSN